MAEHRMDAPTGWRKLSDDKLEELVASDLQTWLDISVCDPGTLPQVLEPTPGQLAVFATHELVESLYNEGVRTTLWNDAGGTLPAALEGFRLMGMPEMERFVRKVISFLEFTPYPYDDEVRRRKLPEYPEFEEEFEQLYREFESAISKRPEAVVAYIRAHPDEFFRQ